MLPIEVRVQGQIAEHWSEWFSDLRITHEGDGQTVLTGSLPDQAALHGLLARLWNLGLALVSVHVGDAERIHTNVRAVIERWGPAGREVLLQMRHKPYEGRPCLELPGGRVEPFESLAAALCREVREETGLELAWVGGLDRRVEAVGAGSRVECLPPLAAYQTLQGPVDSLGVYFVCRAEGQPVEHGDEAGEARWVGLDELARMLELEPDQFSWVDRAGLMFYLQAARSGKLEDINFSRKEL